MQIRAAELQSFLKQAAQTEEELQEQYKKLLERREKLRAEVAALYMP